MSTQKFRVQDGIVFPDGTEQTSSLAPELTKVGGNLVSTTTLEFQGTVSGAIFDIDSSGNFDVWLNSVTGDGTGKIYAIGSNDDGYNFVYCLSTTGTVVWKIGLDSILDHETVPYGLKYNNGYLYLACQYYNNDAGNDQVAVIKLNAADGTVSTFWVLSNSSGVGYQPRDIVVNSSGEPVVVGQTWGERQTFTGLTPQAGSGPQVLVVNASDLNNYAQDNPWNEFQVHTDPSDPTAWYGTSFNVNWFLSIPCETVTGTGTGVTLNLRYMYYQGDNAWKFDYGTSQGGSGYANGDQLKILGSTIGGTDGVDDIILEWYSWYLNVVSVGGVAGNICPSFVSNKVRLNTSQNVDYSTGTWDIRVALDSQAFVWTPNWQHSFGAAGSENFGSVCVDSADNVYLLGEFQYYDGTYWHNSLAMKLNSSGVQQWARHIEDDSNGSQNPGSIFTDASDNVYITSENNSGYTLVTKFDNSGNFVWQVKQTDNNNWNNYPVGGVDSNGDIIVMGSWYNGNNYVINAHKLSGTDGSLVWSRDFDNQQQYDIYDYYDEYCQGGRVVGDNFYFGAYCYDANDDRYVGVGFKLPTDGTGTGTYDRYSYSENTNTAYENSNQVITDYTTPAVDGASTNAIEASASVTADSVGATTVHKWTIGTGGSLTGVDSITFGDGTTQTTAAGGAITWTNPNSNVWRIETYNGGAAVSYNGGDNDAKWFDIANHTSGSSNFRGAIINYHAYSNQGGTVIGTIHLAHDFNGQTATHTEHLSGGSNLQYLTLWDGNGERGQLFAKMTNGYSVDVMIQWTATVFYGQEFNC